MPDYRPINATTHFKCALDVESFSDEEPLMVTLRKLVRNWVKRKVGEDAGQSIFKSWFFNGNPKGRPHSILNGHQIRTGAVATDDISNPSAWALELIHRDFDKPARRWSVDIGLVQTEDRRVRFTTVVSHWMIANYIGAYPYPPLFNTPVFLRWLMGNENLICRRGDTVLSNQYEVVTHDNVNTIYDQLKNSQRKVPFVFVTRRAHTKDLVIDPVQLYRYLLGNANVFSFYDESVLEGMNYLLGDAYRCEPGSVRCYQTHFDRKRVDNSQIHRYFSNNEIEKDPKFVIRAIANGFARNSNCFYPKDLTQFTDIFVLRRTETIKRLMANAVNPDSANAEELQMFMDENERLEKEKMELEIFADQCMREKEEAETVMGNQQYQIREAEKLRKEFKDAEQAIAAIESFASLPKTLSEVLTKISHLFPQKVCIAANAFKTAGEHTNAHAYWRKAENISAAWEMCFDLVTKGHRLMFEMDGGDKERMFNDESQFELAMKEGKQTKKDSRLVNLRKIEFEERDFDISPHLKLGNKPDKLLRLHFAIDNQNQRLIIGHFGAHIENATTRSVS